MFKRRGEAVAMGAFCALTLGACGSRGTGGAPPPPSGLSLSASEIDDVVAFLCTPTDGYDPKDPAAYPAPAQCLAGAP